MDPPGPRKPLRLILLGLTLSGCLGVGHSGATLSPASEQTLLPTPSPAAFAPGAAIPTSAPSATPVPPAPTLAPPSPTPSPPVRLAAVGDIMLSRSIGKRILTQGLDAPFAGAAQALHEADLAVGNLECAIGTGGRAATKAYTFLAPPEAAAALGRAGFRVLNLANNHVLDYGPEVLAQTLSLLREQGIGTVGAGADEAEAYQPLLVEVRGMRLAFLGFAAVPVETTGFDARQWEARAGRPGIAWATEARIRQSVASALTQADAVIVFLHAGWEGRSSPSSEQQTLARAAIDSGAIAVLGSHPHVLQEIEKSPREGRLIAYSLGNFVFDEFAGPANRSVILQLAVTPQGIESSTQVPVEIRAGFPILVR